MISRLQTPKAFGLLYLDLPPLAVSLAVAEWFFKFGTFTLEALAFLSLWYVLKVVYTKGLSFLSSLSLPKTLSKQP